MPFTAEEIEAAPPCVRIEVQERLCRIDKKVRDFRASGQPDRRGVPKPEKWPHPWRDETNSITAIFRQRRMAIPRG